MYGRAKYVEPGKINWPDIKDPHASRKYDGAHFFLTVESDGSLKYYSRRPSVKGGFPERSSQLPQLTAKKMPEYAGNVYAVELIHTGYKKQNKESHPDVGGILNSLPPRSISVQAATGPVRAVLLDTINPALPTYGDKIKHMEEFEKRYGNSDVLFVPPYERTKAGIVKLIEQTKKEGREGIIVISHTAPEEINPRVKIKHYDTYNLVISRIIQEYDINGKPKQSMGAVEVKDRTGRIVANVGSGWNRQQRLDAWLNPKQWIGKMIQVKTMGEAVPGGRLRMPVYNGEPDGQLDIVD